MLPPKHTHTITRQRKHICSHKVEYVSRAKASLRSPIGEGKKVRKVVSKKSRTSEGASLITFGRYEGKRRTQVRKDVCSRPMELGIETRAHQRLSSIETLGSPFTAPLLRTKKKQTRGNQRWLLFLNVSKNSSPVKDVMTVWLCCSWSVQS